MGQTLLAFWKQLYATGKALSTVRGKMMKLFKPKELWAVLLLLPSFSLLLLGCGSGGSDKVQVRYGSQQDRLNAANSRAASEKEATARSMGSAFSSTSGYSSSPSVTGLSSQGYSAKSKSSATASSSSKLGSSTFSDIAPYLLGGLALISTGIVSKQNISKILPSRKEKEPNTVLSKTASPANKNSDDLPNKPNTNGSLKNIQGLYRSDCPTSSTAANNSIPGVKQVLDFTDSQKNKEKWI